MQQLNALTKDKFEELLLTAREIKGSLGTINERCKLSENCILRPALLCPLLSYAALCGTSTLEPGPHELRHGIRAIIPETKKDILLLCTMLAVKVVLCDVVVFYEEFL